MIRLPDARFLAVVRLVRFARPHVGLLAGSGERNADRSAQAPSGGDTSYAGMVWHEGLCGISYYSSHQGKTAIYLAQVEVEGLRGPSKGSE